MIQAYPFHIKCSTTQEEIDYFWGKLSADAEAERCGWLKNKDDVSWQITPAILQELLRGKTRIAPIGLPRRSSR